MNGDHSKGEGGRRSGSMRRKDLRMRVKEAGEGVTGLPGLTGGLRPGLNPWARPAHRGAQHHLPRGPVPAPDSATTPGGLVGEGCPARGRAPPPLAGPRRAGQRVARAGRGGPVTYREESARQLVTSRGSRRQLAAPTGPLRKGSTQV